MTEEVENEMGGRKGMGEREVVEKARERQWDIMLKAGATILHAKSKERKGRAVPLHDRVVQ